MAFKSLSIIFPLNNIMISSSFCCSPLIKDVNSFCLAAKRSFLGQILPEHFAVKQNSRPFGWRFLYVFHGMRYIARDVIPADFQPRDDLVDGYAGRTIF